jgi:catechol 2,3-dioxygenase-like lactoylglutathione lyase family enzyme
VPAKVRFVYSGIRVRNLARSIRFYRQLGFHIVKRGSFSHGGRYVHLAFPGSTHRLELNFYPRGSRYFEPFVAGASFDHFGFSADAPEAWLRNARRAGAPLVLGYTDRPQQQLYFVRDPDGTWLGVYGPLQRSKSAERPTRPPRPPSRPKTSGTPAPRRRRGKNP